MILECFSSAGSCRSFGLGLACGLMLASAAFMVLDRPGARLDAGAGTAASLAASGTAWHHPAAGSDLASAVRVSAALLPRQAATAAAQGEASGRGGAHQLLARAEEHRRKREFGQACTLYAAVVAQGGMTADAWADYADAQASLSGRLAGAPARAIEAALALDPSHAKALWLRASLAHEEHRYAEALATWRRLLAVVPTGSTDARIIEANIAEAARLATG